MTDLELEELIANHDMMAAHVQKLQADYNQLQEKYRMACWLLRDAADTLACMDGVVDHPLISILQFLEKNN